MSKEWKPKFKVGDEVITVIATQWIDEIDVALVEIIGYYPIGYEVKILKVIRVDNRYRFSKSGRKDNFHSGWIEETPLEYRDKVITIMKKQIKEPEQLKQCLSILEEQTFIIDSHKKEKVSFT